MNLKFLDSKLFLITRKYNITELQVSLIYTISFYLYNIFFLKKAKI